MILGSVLGYIGFGALVTYKVYSFEKGNGDKKSLWYKVFYPVEAFVRNQHLCFGEIDTNNASRLKLFVYLGVSTISWPLRFLWFAFIAACLLVVRFFGMFGLGILLM